MTIRTPPATEAPGPDTDPRDIPADVLPPTAPDPVHGQDFDALVFIGRFQPFHKGHRAVVAMALARARHVVVLVGSAHRARSLRNPFTFEERAEMIRGTFAAPDNARLLVLPLTDATYNDAVWERRVQDTVGRALAAVGVAGGEAGPRAPAPRIGLIGHARDHTSYYLKRFPQWDSLNAPPVDHLAATPLREAFLAGRQPDPGALPAASLAVVERVAAGAAGEDLRQEAKVIRKYRDAWAHAPYPPTFVTVDAVVVQSGHILLIERRARPGKGLWALPGGFLDPGESMLEGCLRELREETRLKVPQPVLEGSVKASRVFDDPHRSARGRTITQAFLIELKPDIQLPKVKGADDAREAFWVPLSEVGPERLFEDHYFIIQALTGIA